MVRLTQPSWGALGVMCRMGLDGTPDPAVMGGTQGDASSVKAADGQKQRDLLSLTLHARPISDNRCVLNPRLSARVCAVSGTAASTIHAVHGQKAAMHGRKTCPREARRQQRLLSGAWAKRP